jgi:hypothetical protein
LFSWRRVGTGIQHFLPDTSGNKEYTTDKMSEFLAVKSFGIHLLCTPPLMFFHYIMDSSSISCTVPVHYTLQSKRIYTTGQ